MAASTTPLEQALAGLLASPAQVRAARDGDAVAGARPRVVAAPTSEDEVAALLAYADREGLKALPSGGGTQLAYGFPPGGGDILLSLARLDAVIEHAPHDLTVTVQAGMPLAALQATLAAAGQWLALDPALPDGATIGGIIATNASGPRRLRYGGVRDHIIGVRVALASGTLFKGGGKVVKNVAGYDLPKLYTGSLGTLGVIVAATFRLYPLSEISRTVTLTAPTWEPLCALAQQVTASTLEPTILDIATTPPGDYVFAARFETVAEAAEQQAARLVEMAGPLGGTARILTSDDEAAFWIALRANQMPPGAAGNALAIKVSLLPTDIAPWLAQATAIAGAHDLQLLWRAHAGHGLVFVHLGGPEGSLLDAVAPLRQAALERHGSLAVLDAPPALAGRLDPFGPSPALELMRRIKAQFDPHATLNPGRFIGRI